MANNRYKFLTEKDEYEIFNLVRNAFLSAHNGRDVEKIINALLTTDERIKIGRRIKIAEMMILGTTGEDIMGTLHVGRNSVTLVSKHLDRYQEGFELILKRQKKVEKAYKEKAHRLSGGSRLILKKKRYTGFKRKDVKM
ncbi:MAG: hypothetical protein COU26_04890 [Candidatus Levybacteria bacterium CG10_big_fil_rev_8_21_14_0_10_36_30]|nr:MAG: hypothetical protein COU26_04890 [Candidatus Levybacteria bacterium CG10_big_fil_rev_8_21_14_0_10_36_30]